MKRSILLLISTLVGIAGASAQVYTFEELDGSWRERTRSGKNNTIITFKDSIYLDISANGYVKMDKPKKIIFDGWAGMEGEWLLIDGERYEIQSVEENFLKLRNGSVTHRFERAKAAGASIAPPPPLPVEREEPATAAVLMGKWFVYKKTDPEFSRNKFYIKKFSIDTITAKGYYAGSIDIHNMDSLYSKRMQIRITGDMMNIVTYERSFNTRIVKNDGKEMILEHYGTLYYLKRED